MIFEGVKLDKLINRLNDSNLRSVYLNAIPGKRLGRLETVLFEMLGEGFEKQLIEKIFTQDEGKVQFSIFKNKESENNSLEKISVLDKKLKRVSKNGRDYLHETGIHTLAIGYPILVMPPDHQRANSIVSPIFLKKISISRSQDKLHSWTVSWEDQFCILNNDTLQSYLLNEYKIKVPNCEISGKNACLFSDLELQIEKIARVLDVENAEVNTINLQDVVCNLAAKENNKKFGIILHTGVISTFKAQKEAVIEDLTYWKRNGYSFPSETRISGSAFAGMETDPSQQKILEKVNGSNESVMLIQGPPGTGKSRTLTAIISNALQQGRKCLVICEKRAANEVIFENLHQLGYKDIILNIDDPEEDRGMILNKFYQLLDHSTNNNPESEAYRMKYAELLGKYHSQTEEVNDALALRKKVQFEGMGWEELFIRIISNPLFEKIEVIDKEFGLEGLDLSDKNYDDFKDLIIYGHKRFREWPGFTTPETDILFDHAFSVRTHPKQTSLEKIAEVVRMLKILRNELTLQSEKLREESAPFQTHLFKNDWFTTFKVNTLAIFSYRFRVIRKLRESLIAIYQEMINKTNHLAFFSYQFSEIESIGNLQDVFEVNKNLIDCGINRVLQDIDNYEKYYEWRVLKHWYPNFVSFLEYTFNQNYDDISDLTELVVSYSFLKKALSDKCPYLSIPELGNDNNRLHEAFHNKTWTGWQERRYTTLQKTIAAGLNIRKLYNLPKRGVRKNSLRLILENSFHLFTDFFPVILTNPAAACTILPKEQNIFDLVIFDEASQLRIEDTFTSLLRGRKIIISGDEQQMPPTDFFSTIDIEEEWEEDVLEQPDLSASLLTNMDYDPGNKVYLDYHYRSQHPWLIDFSNAAFYGNRLIPIPAVNDLKPIEYLNVNGIYLKNRTNPREAEEVISIISHGVVVDSGNIPSVGIASFNLAQALLIEDMIEVKCEHDEAFRQKIVKLENRGFFIRNLENVQGDERDIIIISTTFGEDADGRFIQNFGPVGNLENGHRRLNVLITRAKSKIYLVSSIPEKFFSQSRHERENCVSGKNALYAYLEYAKAASERNLERMHEVLDTIQINNGSSRSFPLNDNLARCRNQLVQYIKAIHPDCNALSPYKYAGLSFDFALIRGNNAERPDGLIDLDEPQHYSDNLKSAYKYIAFKKAIVEQRLHIPYYRLWPEEWIDHPVDSSTGFREFVNQCVSEFVN